MFRIRRSICSILIYTLLMQTIFLSPYALAEEGTLEFGALASNDSSKCSGSEYASENDPEYNSEVFTEDTSDSSSEISFQTQYESVAPSLTFFSSLTGASPDEPVKPAVGLTPYTAASPSEYLTFSSANSFTISAARGWDAEMLCSSDAENWYIWEGDVISAYDAGGEYRLYICGCRNTIVSGSYNNGSNYNGWTIKSNQTTKVKEDGVYCSGNIDALLNHDTSKINYETIQPKTFAGLFYGNSCLTSCSELHMSNIVHEQCYASMFCNCSNLEDAPSLPATTLASMCYWEMFKGCVNLKSAPELKAGVTVDGVAYGSLAVLCYCSMFEGCKSLSTAPALNAQVLVDSCYDSMFRGCISLTKLPKLPALTLSEGCYASMFQECSGIVEIDSTEVLPATILSPYCYTSMFQGCTSLTDLPVLTATTLAEGCYMYMFYDCTGISVSTCQPGKPWKVADSGIDTSSADLYNYEMLSGTNQDIPYPLSTDPVKGETYYIKSATCKLEFSFDEAGSVVPASLTAPYDSSITINGCHITVGSVEAVATPSDNPRLVYTFDHWEMADDNTKPIPDKLVEDLNLKAVFTSTERFYDVSIESSDTGLGTVDASLVSVHYEDPITISGNTAVIGTGTEAVTVTATPKSESNGSTYRFDHWEGDDGTGAQVLANGTEVKVNSAYSLKAVFTSSLIDYTVNVVSNNTEYGTVTPASGTFHYGDTIAITDNKLSGTGFSSDVTATAKDPDKKATYAFSHWEDANAPGTPLSGSITVTGNQQFTAVFSANLIDYSITFSSGNTEYGMVSTGQLTANYGDVISISGNTAVYGSTTVTATANPAGTTYSYRFDHWEDASAPGVALSGNITVSDNQALVAVFTSKLIDYSVSFSSNNTSCGTVSATGLTVHYGDTVIFSGNTAVYNSTTITASAKAADAANTYSFVRWEDASVPGTALSGNISVTGNRTVTAIFTATRKSYTVSFDANGQGTVPESFTVVNGDKITKPTDPSASGYTFSGWYTDQACSADKKWDFDTNVMPAYDLKLYAGWTKNQSGGGSTGGGGSSSGGGGSSGISVAKVASTVPTFSKRWFVDALGVWRITYKNGELIVSRWLCDDAVPANGTNVWYLINTDGTMLAANLVQDNTGNYYSLETSHYGYFGSLRYKNGYYDGIYIEFSQRHDGTFGAIQNQEAIEALKAKYGLTKFEVGNEHIVMTSSLE